MDTLFGPMRTTYHKACEQRVIVPWVAYVFRRALLREKRFRFPRSNIRVHRISLAIRRCIRFLCCCLIVLAFSLSV